MKKLYLLFLSVGICVNLIAQQKLSTIMTVSPGVSVIVMPGTTLNASEVTLKSASDSYSSLFLNGALGASTIVNYDRYVNQVGVKNVAGGNDLISMPVKASGATFDDFLNYTNGTTINSAVIPHSLTTTTIYAFGPYNNVAGIYTNYDSSVDGKVPMIRGKGYRAASHFGQTVRFTGTISTSTETVPITTSNGNNWNTVGNPYPTYISSRTFLEENLAVLKSSATAIYGYNSATNKSSNGTIGNFTIINFNTNADINIAPGQGFLVANNSNKSTNLITFTQAMRTAVGADDFILGKDEYPNHKLRLRAAHDSSDFATEFYFNTNSTQGLDPGFDAVVFSGSGYNFMLYSQLVKNNLDEHLAIQSLGLTDLNEINIPLGLKTPQGKKVTFNIEESTLPENIQVYLEDRQNNTLTLLNAKDYTFTSDVAISGTGRFFLRMESKLLSTLDNESSNLQIISSKKILFINGQLLADTLVSIYDIQGRIVLSSKLKGGSETNTLDTTTLSSGIYVVKLYNTQQFQTKKVLIN